MYSASRIVGFVCITLTIILWAVTLMTDPTPESVGAAACLTAIVVVVGTFGLRT